MITLLVAAMLASPPGAGGPLRPHTLRPCSTAALDFTDHRVPALRAALLFTAVTIAATAVLLVVLVRLELHPLLAVELVGAVALLAVHAAVKTVGAVLGTAHSGQTTGQTTGQTAVAGG